MQYALLPERVAARRRMLEDKAKCTFGLTLLRILSRDEKKNFAISPLSLGIAFSMLSSGLTGETKTELLDALRALDEKALNALDFRLVTHKGLPLKMANEILATRDCAISEYYEKLFEGSYDARIESVDFANDIDVIETNVNAWVSEKTDDLIPRLLPENAIGTDSAIVLISAIYFNECWIEDFVRLRDPMIFTLDSGEKIKRDFIAKKSELFDLIETAQLRNVKIPLDAGFCMILTIPRDPTKRIADLVAAMQPSDFLALMEKPRPRNRGAVMVTLPKFKIEYDFTTVQENLRELGVNKVFDPDHGDFGNLFSNASLSLQLDQIIHKAIVDIDERGGKAAADYAEMASCCAQGPTTTIIFDRPFCFWILSGNHIVSVVGICAEP